MDIFYILLSLAFGSLLFLVPDLISYLDFVVANSKRKCGRFDVLCSLLFSYLFDGYCYAPFVFIGFTRYPTVEELLDNVVDAEWGGRYAETDVGIYHSSCNGQGLDCLESGSIVGSQYFSNINGVLRYVSDTHVQIPTRNWDRVARNAHGVAQDMLTNIPGLPPNDGSLVTNRSGIDMTYTGGRTSRATVIKKASAMASARYLLGPDALQGEFNDNLAMAMETFADSAISTSINPSSNLFRKLVTTLRIPLQYDPRIQEHDAAGTCRRAWVAKMRDQVKWGRVGMVSPSLVEWHSNPGGVAYYHDMEGVNRARLEKPCGKCSARRCAVYTLAKADGRIANSLDSAVWLFKKFGVDYLWMVNIEPNMHSSNVLHLMVKAGIENGYSAVHVDWNVVHMNSSYCDITGQETTRSMSKVISKFGGSGSYVQDYTAVRALFAPTFAFGKALRRTIVGRAGTSMLLELNVDHGGFGTSFIPDKWQYYLIPVPHPSNGVIYLKIEKVGFDRVMQLFRTVVNRNIEAARIQLRQSNVTYSVAGTALTPRLELTATRYELLALWMVSYSMIMDEVSRVGVAEINASTHVMTSGSAKKVASSLYTTISSKILANSDDQNPQFGSASVVRRYLNVCEADGRFLTLDEISEKAYEDMFGHGYAVDVAVNSLSAAYGKLYSKIPGVYNSIKFVSTLTRNAWHSGFNAADVLAKAMIMTAVVNKETIGFVVDLSIHICRVLGINHNQMQVLRNYIDTVNLPVGQVWIDISDAQELDFQAASIKIVESLINNFSPEPSLLAVVEEAMNNNQVLNSSEAEAYNQTMADLQYTRILTEMKIFLGSINSRGARISQMHSILSHATERRHSLPVHVQENIDRLISDAKDVIKSLPDTQDVAFQNSCFNVSMRVPVMQRLPIPEVVVTDANFKPIQTTTASHAFKEFMTVDLDATNEVDEHRYLKRLRVVEGKTDFDPVHEDMESAYPGTVTAEDPSEVPDLQPGAQCSYSPDAAGGKFLKNIALKAVRQSFNDPRCRTPFASNEQLREWIDLRSQTSIVPVKNAIQNSVSRIDQRPIPFIMHIDGLAMGGKSAGIRHWISENDVVIVPTTKLKKSWQKELGELDPIHRATVMTQHVGMNCNAARFIIIDEVYTFETPHLELIRRSKNALGLITIGDGHQINDVFAEGTSTFAPGFNRPFFMAIAPVSFCPYDVVLQYLRNNRSGVYNKVYYCGSTSESGLYYSIESDEIVQTSNQDLAINGTQNAKALQIARGNTDAITAHESQGSRCSKAFVHLTEVGLGCPDMNFLKNNPKHFGVVITRAREFTCFIVKDRASIKSIPFIDASAVNGVIPSDVLFAGVPTFDLVDPIVQDTITFTRVENTNVKATGNEMQMCDARYTVGSFIDMETLEAVPKEAFNAEIDVSPASIVNTHLSKHNHTTDETFLFNPAAVPGSGLINMMERRTPPTIITDKHFNTAEKIIHLLFERVIDKRKFFKYSSEQRSSIKQQTRDQVIKMAEGQQSSRSDTVSFAFPKNEPAKKVMTLGKGLKALSVTAMNQTQLALFGDMAALLTHVWSRSLQPGIISPVGHTKPEIARVLGSMTHSWEIDLEKQDSTHSAVHVAVFVLLIEIVAKRQGMSVLAKEIRESRCIGDMQGVMRIVMGTGLGSGDIWTLIANKIMAFSTLVSLYEIPPNKIMLQVGDDITCDRKFKKRKVPICGSEGVTLKIIDNSNGGRPSFTSNVSISPDMSIAARVRGIIKMAYSPRTRSQHISYKVECDNIKDTLSLIGIGEYAFVFQQLFGAEPGFVEHIVNEACKYAYMDFDDIPESIKMHSADEKKCMVHSKETGCFGYALSHVLPDNVQALNALTKFNGPVAKSVAIQECIDNRVVYEVMNCNFSKGKIESCVDSYLKRNSSVGVVYIFDDHAISITCISNETVTFGGTHRYRINLVTNSVDELDF